MLTEHDLGVHIDLINRDIYQGDGNAVLDPADEKLLEDDVLTPQDSKRSRHHAKSVSWLRRSEYISTEQTRFQPQSMEKVRKMIYIIRCKLQECFEWWQAVQEWWIFTEEHAIIPEYIWEDGPQYYAIK